MKSKNREIEKERAQAQSAFMFNAHIQPRAGFVYPAVGDAIKCVADYKTGAIDEGTLPAGAKGEVVALRMPGTFKEVQGYIGCVVFFEAVKKAYPYGFVVPWDKVSDPSLFEFSKT